MNPNTQVVLVNFGGPRNEEEIFPFLNALLCDRDVVRTKFPNWIHRLLFGLIAKKRSLRIKEDYDAIGGGSPIYSDTEELSKELSKYLDRQVLTFHRYLPQTHQEALCRIENSEAKTICIFPLFPQFCYATTGSIARFFQNRLSKKTLNKLRWIKSYAAHNAFIASYQKKISDFLHAKSLQSKECIFIFSAHGVPVSFVNEGDPYQSECELSFKKCLEAFPEAMGVLTYQSKFGKGEWLLPATDQFCQNILNYSEKRKHAVFIPISFTSDHIETLFEIEKLYLPLIVSQGLSAHRCPALNLEEYWVEGITQILKETNWCTNAMLYRS